MGGVGGWGGWGGWGWVRGWVISQSEACGPLMPLQQKENMPDETTPRASLIGPLWSLKPREL